MYDSHGDNLDFSDQPSFHTIRCSKCGYLETWEVGNYMGERDDFAEHVCGAY